MAEGSSLFRRYLLGALDESEEEAFEKKLMTSDEHFQELLIAEDELVDDYWAGKLDTKEEQGYRERFLATSERRQQHRFGAALKKHLSKEVALDAGAPATGRFRMALAAAAAALIAVGVWSVIEKDAPVRLEQTAALVEGPTRTVYLTDRRLRSLQPQTQAIPVSDVAVLELQVPTGTSGDYGVTIEDARSNRILAEGTLSARTVEGQWIVVAAVSSELLSPGDYRVVLRSPSDEAVLATYEFRTTSG